MCARTFECLGAYARLHFETDVRERLHHHAHKSGVAQSRPASTSSIADCFEKQSSSSLPPPLPLN
jgi:hypothetical protein